MDANHKGWNTVRGHSPNDFNSVSAAQNQTKQTKIKQYMYTKVFVKSQYIDGILSPFIYKSH